MNAEGVNAIIQAGREAADVQLPFVIEGPGYKKLATLEAGEWKTEELPRKEDRPEKLTVHTLTGFVEYVKANRDEVKLEESIVQVADHKTVRLISRTGGAFHQRTYHLEAVFEPLLGTGNPAFSFGQFTDVESFSIALQALFVETEPRAGVLKIVGNIREEGIQETSDDGITQSVVVRGGVALGRPADIPNPVTLAPFRTFREVEQPASKFVLRARGGKGESPKVALFEADGGAWKLQAIENVRAYLTASLKDAVAIVA